MKKVIIMHIVLMVICVGFLSGCNEESTPKLPVTSQSIDNFAINLDDLPDGYTQMSEEFNDTGGTLLDGTYYEELYGSTFSYNYTQEYNKTYPIIANSITKLASNNVASKYFQNQTPNFDTDSITMNNITPNEVELIGDESIFKLYQGEFEMYGITNWTYSYLLFRIKNIIVMFLIYGASDSEIDYISFTYNLAEIVKNRYLESLK